jgi:hypothetical protein
MKVIYLPSLALQVARFIFLLSLSLTFPFLFLFIAYQNSDISGASFRQSFLLLLLHVEEYDNKYQDSDRKNQLHIYYTPITYME